jgi:hypothetical protein
VLFCLVVLGLPCELILLSLCVDPRCISVHHKEQRGSKQGLHMAVGAHVCAFFTSQKVSLCCPSTHHCLTPPPLHVHHPPPPPHTHTHLPTPLGRWVTLSR